MVNPVLPSARGALCLRPGTLSLLNGKRGSQERKREPCVSCFSIHVLGLILGYELWQSECSCGHSYMTKPFPMTHTLISQVLINTHAVYTSSIDSSHRTHSQ